MSRQVLDIFIALKTCAGNSKYVLPSCYDADAPMSRATFNRVTYLVVEQAKKGPFRQLGTGPSSGAVAPCHSTRHCTHSAAASVQSSRTAITAASTATPSVAQRPASPGLAAARRSQPCSATKYDLTSARQQDRSFPEAASMSAHVRDLRGLTASSILQILAHLRGLLIEGHVVGVVHCIQSTIRVRIDAGKQAIEVVRFRTRLGDQLEGFI
jgi:hypothetical protein